MDTTIKRDRYQVRRSIVINSINDINMKRCINKANHG